MALHVGRDFRLQIGLHGIHQQSARFVKKLEL
jgi:hypothetical protein